MQVIEVRLVVKDENADVTNEYGLNERAYVALSNAIGGSGVGEVLDIRKVHRAAEVAPAL